ncbi:MAG: hypothetical protein KAW17_09655 [Candidatus Eisenbacteria sp.]|nr:hypothetical protein [Candidatus Eisenbacteria bacterium]
MKIYEVRQVFVTLGDWTPETHRTSVAAEIAAAKWRVEVAQTVAVMGCIEEDLPKTAPANEAGAWKRARDIAGGSRRYGAEAAKYIAEQAVVIIEYTAGTTRTIEDIQYDVDQIDTRVSRLAHEIHDVALAHDITVSQFEDGVTAEICEALRCIHLNAKDFASDLLGGDPQW